MYTALGCLSCKNCNLSVSPLDRISRKVEGNESRGEGEAEEERGSRGVEKWRSGGGEEGGGKRKLGAWIREFYHGVQ